MNQICKFLLHITSLNIDKVYFKSGSVSCSSSSLSSRSDPPEFSNSKDYLEEWRGLREMLTFFFFLFLFFFLNELDLFIRGELKPLVIAAPSENDDPLASLLLSFSPALSFWSFSGTKRAM